MGHEDAIARLKAEAIVECLSLEVVAFDFEVECFDVELAASGFEEVEGLSADALVAIAWPQVEFIDEGIASAVFEAVAQRENDIADSEVLTLDEIDEAVSGILENAGEGGLGEGGNEGHRVGIEIGHEGEEEIEMGDRGLLKLDVLTHRRNCLSREAAKCS